MADIEGPVCRGNHGAKGELTERARSANLDYVQALTGTSLMVRLNSLHYVQTSMPQLVQIVQDRYALLSGLCWLCCVGPAGCSLGPAASTSSMECRLQRISGPHQVPPEAVMHSLPLNLA